MSAGNRSLILRVHPELRSTESMAAQVSWQRKAAVHVIGLSGDRHETGSNNDQGHGAHRGEHGIRVSPNHLPGRELLAAVIAHGLFSGPPRMPCDPRDAARLKPQTAAGRRCCRA